MCRFAMIALALFILSQSVLAADPPPDVQQLVQGNTAFALDLFSKLREREGNLSFSPYSISSALTMSSAGARGPTAAEMATVLRLGLPPARLHPACAELTRSLHNHGLPGDCQLHVANALWGDNGLITGSDFQKLMRRHYGAGLRPVSFGNSELARQTINRWVQQRTNHKIPELLQARDIDNSTRLVLVNSLYFQGAWEIPFNTLPTDRQATFHLANGQPATVAMMRQVGRFSCLEEMNFQALELPYEGGELSMVILLPRDRDGLSNFEQGLTATKLATWLDKLQPVDVAVNLPKFKVKSRFNLGDTLQSMGMRLPFERGQADFTGIAPHEQLFISKVVHEAVIDLNEAGTEATAATAVAYSRGETLTSSSFVADHPFLFLLRDRRTGSILFLGRVANPSAE